MHFFDIIVSCVIHLIHISNCWHTKLHSFLYAYQYCSIYSLACSSVNLYSLSNNWYTFSLVPPKSLHALIVICKFSVLPVTNPSLLIHFHSNIYNAILFKILYTLNHRGHLPLLVFLLALNTLS